MIPIEMILFPTDGSEGSRTAMGHALSLARQHGARAVALHIIVRRWEGDGTLRALGPDLRQQIWDGYAEEGRRLLGEDITVGKQAGVAVEILPVGIEGRGEGTEGR